jgi:hypothetical protein
MKILTLLLLILAGPVPGAVVELLPGSSRAVFGGGLRSFEVFFHNRGATNFRAALQVQLLQTSSSTTASWSEPRPWRTITLAQDQTSVEQVSINFPVVRAESQFLIRFVHDRAVVGLIPVRVFPNGLLTNLVSNLPSITIAFTQPELQQILVEAGIQVDTRELTTPEVTSRSRLMIFGPGFMEGATPSVIADARSWAKAGVPVVLILPDEDPRMISAPSYYPAIIGKGILVTVRAGTFADLLTDPRSQMRLARVLRLALGQESLQAPESIL